MPPLLIITLVAERVVFQLLKTRVPVSESEVSDGVELVSSAVPAAIVTTSPATGTASSAQLPAVNQSAETEPSHVRVSPKAVPAPPTNNVSATT
jgi:hypothetical protein